MISLVEALVTRHGHSVEPGRRQAEADRLLDRMAGRFVRVETRRRVRRFLLGLPADLPRKNCWTIAEHAGEVDPHGVRYLLARARWDNDGVRDDLREDVAACAAPAARPGRWPSCATAES